jgi:hypothetical protein
LKEKNIGIGDNVPSIDIYVLCQCGKELKIDLKGWDIEVKGTLTFICPSCEGSVESVNLLKRKKKYDKVRE